MRPDQQDPDQIKAHLTDASALEALGRHDEAIAHYDRALHIDPVREEALGGKERVAEKLGQSMLALSMWSEVLRRFPDKPEYRVRSAQLQLRLGDERAAYNELTRIAAEFPNFGDAQLLAGHAARWVERSEDALKWFRAAALKTGQPHPLLEAARELCRLERFGEADECAARIEPQLADDPAFTELRIAVLSRRNLPAARDALICALGRERRPDQLASLARLGTHLGMHRESMQGLQAFVDATPKPPASIIIALARCLLSAGETVAAQQRAASVDRTALALGEVQDLADVAIELDDAALTRNLLQQIEDRHAQSRSWTRPALDRTLWICDAAGDIGRIETLVARHAAAPLTFSRTTLAMLGVGEGQQEKAARLIDDEAGQNPQFPADRWRARLALTDGDSLKAVDALAARMKGSPVALQDARLWIRALIDVEQVAKAWEALRRFEGGFALRDLVEERADLLRMDLRFEDELDCLRRAVRRDPLDETFASRLFDWLIAHRETGEARTLLETWLERRPAGLVWAHKRLQLASATHQDWDAVLTEWQVAHERAGPRVRTDLALERVKLLRRNGRFADADAALDQFRSALPALTLSRRTRNELEQKAAHELTWLGRHALARPIFDHQLAMEMTCRMKDEVYRLACANESFGGGDLARYEKLRNSISRQRHHLQITPFPTGSSGEPTRLRVIVLVHLFHADLWPQIREQLASLTGTPFRLCLSIPEGAAPEVALKEALALDPEMRVERVANRGFDVGGHWQALAGVDLRAFDLALLLQTKKSGHTRIGEAWRGNLMRSLIGNAARWQANLLAFAADPRLGMIASALHQSSFHPWSYPEMRRVLRALGMPTEFDALKDLHQFVTGTMFLMRANLLAEMFEKTRDQIAFESFDSMSVLMRMDDSSAHAMERAFGMYVRWRGFGICWRP